MFNIEKYLEKFIKSVKSDEFIKDEVIRVIRSITGIGLEGKDIEFKNNIIYVYGNPGIKNKIFIFKSKILEDFSENIKEKIVDIR